MRISLLATAALTVSTLLAAPAAAQQPYNVAVRVDQLARIFADLYGPSGLVVDSTAALSGGESHSGHFNGGFRSEFSQFGVALTSQLVSLPYPTPAAGFTFEFDPALGVFTRSSNGFGPILSERAETIGARRFAFGVATQRLTFDSIEGVDLARIPAVFQHDDAALLGGREDVITTMNSIDATVTRSTAFLSFGVTSRFDLSVSIPVVTTDIVVTSRATMVRVGTTIPEQHFFRQADDTVGDTRVYTAFGEATGLGDINVRGKLALHKSRRMGLALGVDVKLPTGDEMNLLGTGSTAVQPFGVWSATLGPFSPHVNAGYRWNGPSVLGGAPGAGQQDDLPDVVVYSAGGALEVHRRLTLAVDVLGRAVLDSPRLVRETFRALNTARTPYENIGFRRQTLHELSAATGLKLNVAERLLLNANLLFRLNNQGLRDKISPLIGLEYAF
ncbi:MAG: transporter [Gemmatimonadales bacterium]|nr:transporter [Gemmatimonadales bacterium]